MHHLLSDAVIGWNCRKSKKGGAWAQRSRPPLLTHFWQCAKGEERRRQEEKTQAEEEEGKKETTVEGGKKQKHQRDGKMKRRGDQHRSSGASHGASLSVIDYYETKATRRPCEINEKEKEEEEEGIAKTQRNKKKTTTTTSTTIAIWRPFFARYRLIEITEQSTTINVFPTDETWNSAAISAQKRIFTESAFSKASFSRQCAHELELTPIYYRTGETVRIECFMCSIALVFNGEPKGWARVKSINDFFGKGHKFGSNDGPEIEMVQNAEYLEDENIKENPRKLGEPYYYQEDGFLVIEKANSYSQGVYFCFDEDSVASQRNFYILIPILPVVHIAKKDTQDIDKIKKICEKILGLFWNRNSIK
uniref:Uncharacterized protein n=1 Tax=Caenorhabditis japonica TaxID=281687 RepID=A0A8R1EDV2_CAEJA